MKIAIDARIINSSTGRYVLMLLEYLQYIDSNNEYIVLVREEDKDYWKPAVESFTIKVAEFDNYSLNEQIGFKKLLDELQPDLVHFCMPQQPVFYKGKKVTTVHDLTLLKTYNSDKNYFIFTFKQFVGRFVFKHIARSSTAVIVPTKFTGKEYAEFSDIDQDKLFQIYEAADVVEQMDEPYKELLKQQYIMYVGSQSDYKNVRRLIEAHQLLLQKYPNLKLALVGKTSGKNGIPAGRNKLWSESHKHKNVIFTDFVPDEQLSWLYKNARAYVFPSLMEGFGLPGLEAMLYGTPVISSNTTCLPEVYGDAAEYFDPTDINEMAEKISSVISNDRLRNKLIEKGYDQAAKYSWRRMAQETHAVYMKALGK